MKISRRLLPAACMLIASHAMAADVIRHKIPNSDFPIAMAVEIPAGKTQVYLSGAGPVVADKSLPANTPAAYGDTKAQTINTLEIIQANLKLLKLDMKDVVKMQVFLVGDPAKNGKMDFAGFMEGYVKFFGAAAGQPNLPTRSTMQVAGLANPGWLVEIEVTAVRRK
jgi:enamine deaminase RidA (YjgF/YER057c/UK114 family)